MGEIVYQHQSLAGGRWAEMSFCDQMGNIGSEVSRSLKAQSLGKEKRLQGAIARALELFDLTIACSRGARLKEVCRAREEFCDYFFNDNSFHTDPVKLQRYYDGFAILARR